MPLALLAALAAPARAQLPDSARAPAAAPAPAVDPARSSISVAPTARQDSLSKLRWGGTGSYVRLLAEADSLLKLRGGSHAENAQLYLAWDAPWGMKRAKQVRMPACDDTTAADTLYLSFYPGRSADHFNGITAQLEFMATGADTLGPWWHMESKGGENGGNILVEWGPSPDMPGPQPWPVEGHGFALLDRTPTAMRLRLLYAETLNDAGPIGADTTYTLCRVIFRHHASRRLAGCGQPVCVEWVVGTFGFALKDEPEVRRGERFVSYGAPYAICGPYREAKAQTWKPKPPAARPGNK